ncbi:hypothetical protein G6F70_005305 [Rhizopus microsporus]|nr:hypothetical protein G6F71_002894 [Rhizopus microsporus]KAG1199000.1 hypothetical protein G6F70_005305 [Rhizopus microsporus]KAG1212908.1 hypothetical protein G6F69_003304 [Rhizopus microsporus]KAG1231669.1 hypothetical protein G6F67_005581 [Rhizopus microsporus]KAG1259801.1 hypothetical protein G6F68_007880 [Rhizopus microsporus]
MTSEGADPAVKPIPTSVTITNESTPLLSQEATTATTSNSSFRQQQQQSSVWSMSTDMSIRKREIKGVILLGASSVFFAIVSVFVKYLGNTIPSFEIVLASLTKLPLIDATVLFFVGPIFKIVVASVVLNEMYSFKDGFYSVICFIGLLFVIKPSIFFNVIIDTSRSVAVLCALTGALMSATAYVTVRKIGQETHVLVHIVYFGFVASMISLLVYFVRLQQFVIPDYHQFNNALWMLGAIGPIAFLGQFLLSQGLKMAPTGLASVIQASDVVLAFIFGIALFKEYPGFSTILGSMIVVLMTTWVNVNRWRIYMTKNAAIRRRRSKDRLQQQQQR